MSQTDYNKQILEGDEVARLLGTLPRVEAPSDFDFRVRARIASGQSARKQFAWVPAPVRFAAPLALVLGVGCYFGYNALQSGDVIETPRAAFNPAQAPTAASAPLPPSVEISVPADSDPAREVVSAVRRIESPGRVRPIKAERVIRSKPAKPAGASYDEASTRGTVIKLPIAGTAAKPDGAPAPGIFESAGLDVVSAGSGWRVEAVMTGGSGDRAGVRAGDVIDAVNGPILRVKREGKPVDLVIKP